MRHEVRQRATDFLKQRGDGLTVSDALVEVAAHTGKDPIGLSFGTAA